MRAADVNHDGEVTQEELEEFRQHREQRTKSREALLDPFGSHPSPARSPLWVGDRINAGGPAPPKVPQLSLSGSQTERPRTGPSTVFRKGAFNSMNRDQSGMKLRPQTGYRTTPRIQSRTMPNTARAQMSGTHALTPRLPPGIKQVFSPRHIRPNTCTSGYRVCRETRFT
jgi:hypothetical protein